ncbi:hypothetical protein ACFE04_013728 [Oxalis oulophora]
MGRQPCCSKSEGLNRGQWSAREDALLIRYIETHGEGSWRSLPKKAVATIDSPAESSNDSSKLSKKKRQNKDKKNRSKNDSSTINKNVANKVADHDTQTYNMDVSFSYNSSVISNEENIHGDSSKGGDSNEKGLVDVPNKEQQSQSYAEVESRGQVMNYAPKGVNVANESFDNFEFDWSDIIDTSNYNNQEQFLGYDHDHVFSYGLESSCMDTNEDMLEKMFEEYQQLLQSEEDY